MARIVGINLSHNGSLAIIQDGQVEFYLEEERVTRIKRDVSAKTLADKYIDSSVDAVTICDAFTRCDNRRRRETIETKNRILQIVRAKGIPVVDYRDRHHDCHAANAFYNSPFEDAAVLVMDGKGSYHHGYCEIESIYDKTTPIFKHYSKFYDKDAEELPHFHLGYYYSDRTSVGQAYRTVSEYCGFDERDAGKTMGLSSYGSGDVNIFNEECGHSLCRSDFIPDGDPKNYAYNLQKSAEKHARFMVRKTIELTNKKNICLSGGFFLNCVSNYSILKNIDANLYVDPIAYDGGVAIGSALLEYHEHFCDTPRPKGLGTVLA